MGLNLEDNGVIATRHGIRSGTIMGELTGDAINEKEDSCITLMAKNHGAQAVERTGDMRDISSSITKKTQLIRQPL